MCVPQIPIEYQNRYWKAHSGGRASKIGRGGRSHAEPGNERKWWHGRETGHNEGCANTGKASGTRHPHPASPRRRGVAWSGLRRFGKLSTGELSRADTGHNEHCPARSAGPTWLRRPKSHDFGYILRLGDVGGAGFGRLDDLRAFAMWIGAVPGTIAGLVAVRSMMSLSSLASIDSRSISCLVKARATRGASPGCGGPFRSTRR